MKSKNPLYAVNKKNNIVEEAHSFFDLLVKKYGLESILNFCNMLFDIFITQIRSYAMLNFVVNLMEKILNRIKFFSRYSII